MEHLGIFERMMVGGKGGESYVLRSMRHQSDAWAEILQQVRPPGCGYCVFRLGGTARSASIFYKSNQHSWAECGVRPALTRGTTS